jgi:hypothetical protein
VNLANPEQPVPFRLQGINLDKVSVVELLGDPKFMLGLVLILEVVRSADGHHLECVLLGVGTAADVENGTVGAGPQRSQDLKLADADGSHEFSRFPLNKTNGKK